MAYLANSGVDGHQISGVGIVGTHVGYYMMELHDDA